MSADRYVVIGNPIAHSKSPQIHARFAQQTGEDIHYDRLLAPLDGFDASVREFIAAGGRGARAVLEVRSRDVPFIIEDGQTVGRLVYERMAEAPRALYGRDLGSNYQAQGLKLSKHFRAL